MKFRSAVVLAFCLLWVALQPSPTTRNEVRSMSVGQPQVWDSLPAAVDSQRWWYATLPEPTTTTVTPLRRSGTVSAAAVEAPGSIELLILDTFGSAGPSAVRVARCESRLIPTAQNGQYRGLFQIGPMHAQRWADVTGTDYFSNWMDPAANVATAFSLWQEAGWGPWSCKP